MCLLLFFVVGASIIYISQVGGFLGFVVGVWLFYGLQVFGVLLLILIWLWCDTLVWVWGCWFVGLWGWCNICFSVLVDFLILVGTDVGVGG